MAELYRVIGQRESSQITPDGRFQDGVVVTIETRSGAVLSAFVPYDRYDPETVRDILEDLASRAEGVAGL